MIVVGAAAEPIADRARHVLVDLEPHAAPRRPNATMRSSAMIDAEETLHHRRRAADLAAGELTRPRLRRQAFAIDLTGQVCVDQFEGQFYGGVSTQAAFIRGAARSPGGKPIIGLASTTDDGASRTPRP